MDWLQGLNDKAAEKTQKILDKKAVKPVKSSSRKTKPVKKVAAQKQCQFIVSLWPPFFSICIHALNSLFEYTSYFWAFFRSTWAAIGISMVISDCFFFTEPIFYSHLVFHLCNRFVLVCSTNIVHWFHCDCWFFLHSEKIILNNPKIPISCFRQTSVHRTVSVVCEVCVSWVNRERAAHIIHTSNTALLFFWDGGVLRLSWYHIRPPVDKCQCNATKFLSIRIAWLIVGFSHFISDGLSTIGKHQVHFVRRSNLVVILFFSTFLVEQSMAFAASSVSHCTVNQALSHQHKS